MRKESSRAPSMRCAGASEDTSQLSTADPTVEPIMPPITVPDSPRIAPPKLDPIAEPTAPRTRVAIKNSQVLGKRNAKAMRRRQACVSGCSMTPSRS
ncbi:hypothetical protein ROE7235_02989 [Roseibaca ekhonensis]|uniref:Uncharacterized protein n=1 Tax=Roseinatronobacter ekhonensis TaxID=254356 RepID=A0A3B0MCU5_9RHOB|nr:hypothetical protein ROE7235_02989 [Roseibaca ekhonensis]